VPVIAANPNTHYLDGQLAKTLTLVPGRLRQSFGRSALGIRHLSAADHSRTAEPNAKC
jgi:hypothetical protein